MRAGVHDMSRAEALSALRWWRDAGVDVIVDEMPRNWLAPDRAPAAKALPRVAEALAPLWPVALPAFRHWLETTEALPDGSRAGRRLLPTGDPGSGMMVLLDMPEPADDAAGTLLSGEPGKLFDAMLAAIGRTRDTIYLASLCLARAPGGRLDGDAFEQLTALARHHVALAAPERLLLIGNFSSRALLGINYASARNRLHALARQKSELVNRDGAHDFNRGDIRAVVTIAPQLLLQNPLHKGQAWKDLRLWSGGNEAA